MEIPVLPETQYWYHFLEMIGIFCFYSSHCLPEQESYKGVTLPFLYSKKSLDFALYILSHHCNREKVYTLFLPECNKGQLHYLLFSDHSLREMKIHHWSREKFQMSNETNRAQGGDGTTAVPVLSRSTILFTNFFLSCQVVFAEALAWRCAFVSAWFLSVDAVNYQLQMCIT